MTQFVKPLVFAALASALPPLTAYGAELGPSDIQCQYSVDGRDLGTETLNLTKSNPGYENVSFNGGSIQVPANRFKPSFWMSVNRKTAQATVHTDVGAGPISLQLGLAPGQGFLITVFDGFGGPEGAVECKRGGKSSVAPATAYRCVGKGMSLPSTLGAQPTARSGKASGWIDPSRGNGIAFPICFADSNGDGRDWEIGFNPNEVSFLDGRSQEHVLNDIRASLGKGQSVAVRKSDESGYTDIVC